MLYDTNIILILNNLHLIFCKKKSNMSKNLVVIGAGFAGLWSAIAARRLIHLHGDGATGVKVTLVAPEPKLVVRPRLYEKDAGSMTAPLTELFNVIGVKFVQGSVEKINTGARSLDVVDSAGKHFNLAYDRLVLAAGSSLVKPNIPGLREHSFNIDQLEGAERFENHLKGLASLSPSTARNTVVVVGGGFTGIEIAAELPARLRSILGDNVKTRVVVVERSADIGPDLGAGPRPTITQALTEMGVEIKTGFGVTSIDANGVVTSSGERIESSTVIWTAGMEASALTKQIEGEKDRLGRIHVDRNLRVPQCKDVFATGDTALAATDDEGHFAMMSCQHALRLGRSSGHNAAADLLGAELLPYSQVPYGTCLDLGPWGSMVSAGWERNVIISGSHAKPIKQHVNGCLIYPPKPDMMEAFAQADPQGPLPDLSAFAPVADLSAVASLA